MQLSIQHVSKNFNDNNYTVHAVQDVSLEVRQGEMLAIMGPSGSGKTTLLNLMGIVFPPDSGEIYVDGHKVSAMNDKIRCQMRNQFFGYIVQDFALIEDETALENILVPTLYHKHKKRPAEYRKLIDEMAHQLQIADKLKSKVKKLSGGERQRIAIIRSMVCDQKVILADEPTGSLDKDNAQIVMDRLRSCVDIYQKSVVIVTHDPAIASQCDRTFHLTDGRLTDGCQ